ncbi:PAS domain-containing sensor histidine kinase [Desulfurispirillum indicum]|uniref:PAS domain-containing sensor histidine kinase n=1 Tax=Desulfurispirillum indicum TaxID=936456 RepID=UPI0006764699|nr:PAS domain-containing sensor histidine kinase [Desulfurispirillum indicum]
MKILPLVAQSVLNHLPCGAICVDRQGRVALVNAMAARLWQVAPDTALDISSLTQLMASQLESPEPFVEAVLSYFSSSGQQEIAGQLRQVCGRKIHHAITAIHDECFPEGAWLWSFLPQEEAPAAVPVPAESGASLFADGEITRDLNAVGSLMEALAEMVFFYTLDRTMYFGNVMGRFAPETRLSPGHFFARSIWQIFPHKTARIHEQVNREVLQEATTKVFEWCMSGGDGQEFWFRSSHAPLLDAGGQAVGIVGISMDITRLKSLEENTREQTTYIRNILNFQANLIVVMEGSRLKTCNKAFLDFFHCETKEEFLQRNQSLEQVFVEEEGYLSARDGQWLLRLMENRQRAQETRVLLYDMRRGENRHFLLDFRIMPTGIDEMVLTFTDITELEEYHRLLQDINAYLEIKVQQRTSKLQQVNDLLQTREKLVHTIFETIHVGIVVLDEGGSIVQSNSAFGRICSLGTDELAGKPFEECLRGRSRRSARRMFNRSLTRSQVQGPYHWKVQRHDGAQLRVLFSLSPLAYGSGQDYRLLTITDITRRHAMEERARYQEQMLIQQSRMADMGEMIGVIAHQWKQPLNSIALLAQTISLLFDGQPGEYSRQRIADSLQNILEQVRFMADTIEDFRDFLTPSKEKVNFPLDVAVASILHILAPQLQLSGITPHTSFQSTAGELMLAHGYPNEFKQVILNILVNARDAIEQARSNGQQLQGEHSIDIAIEPLPEHWQLAISDTGGGIPPQMLEKIFEPYMTTKGDQGTGIGLSMSRTIIEDHMGGSIEATNWEKGARILIQLPRAGKSSL